MIFWLRLGVVKYHRFRSGITCLVNIKSDLLIAARLMLSVYMYFLEVIRNHLLTWYQVACIWNFVQFYIDIRIINQIGHFYSYHNLYLYISFSKQLKSGIYSSRIKSVLFIVRLLCRWVHPPDYSRCYVWFVEMSRRCNWTSVLLWKMWLLAWKSGGYQTELAY